MRSRRSRCATRRQHRSLGLDAVVLSTQHDPDIKQKDLVEAVRETC
jgi:S-adenosylmethionine synthetase